MPPGVVLASATSPTEQTLFDELVQRGIDREQLESFHPPGEDGIVHAWPLPMADDIDTDSIDAGDFVLFYGGQNRYSWAAKVRAIEHDSAAIESAFRDILSYRQANVSLPDDQFGPALLYLEIPIPIDLESYRLHDLVGVEQEALTRSLIPDDEAIANLEDEFGSVEAMLRTVRDPPSVFVEVTSLDDKPYKQPDGEYPLGTAVYSPSEAADGSRRYETLRKPKIGDLVLHIRKDSRELTGISTVASTLDETFEGPPDDSWGHDQPDEGYYRALGEYTPFESPPDIDDDLLDNENYRERLRDIYETNDKLFFNTNFELAQGAYFTEIPLAFLYLCIAEYPPLVELAADRYWSIPQPDPVDGYTSVTEAVVDVCTKLPFDRRDRNWFVEVFTTAVIEEFTEALTGLEPGTEVTEQEAGYLSLIKKAYEEEQSAFEAAAEKLGIGRTNQVPPAVTLFFVLFHQLQSRVGIDPNMTQVKAKTIINEEYEVEVPIPEIEVEDESEPLADREKPDRGDDIARQLDAVGQMVFYGPPGTGKTYTAEQFARWWLNDQDGIEPTKAQLETVTFHPSFTYEDFIEGLSVDTEGDNVTYEEQPGVFLDFASKARHVYDASGEDENAPRYVMIIDEINRGNLAQIFGEMITALEKDKRYGEENEVSISLAHSGEKFSIPPNLYLIGTMNTADRSIALVDAALRRRFRFLSFPPNLEEVRDHHGFDNSDQIESAATSASNSNHLIAQSLVAVRVLNNRIREQGDLGRGKQIGHSFFYGLDNERDVVDMWRFEILPLLEEYLFGQYERIRESLFSGHGDQLFDWEHQQIKAFDQAALENALGTLIDDHLEDTEAE